MTAATLVGVGMGPGDPELVTVKAVRVLREADLVLVPVIDTGEQGRAEATVRAHVDHDRIKRVVFAMDAADRARRENAWDAAADAAIEAFQAGARMVAFATIGDPNVYSTFTYLAATVAERFATLVAWPDNPALSDQHPGRAADRSATPSASRRPADPHPHTTQQSAGPSEAEPPAEPPAASGTAELPAHPTGADVLTATDGAERPVGSAESGRFSGLAIETVPGITAMQDLAARSGTVLCEGTETLALLPLTAGLDRFAEALASFDTVVGYKSGRHLPEVLKAVREAGRIDDAVHGTSLGLPGEDIRPAAGVTGSAPYLSTLLIPGKRTARGGKL